MPGGIKDLYSTGLLGDRHGMSGDNRSVSSTQDQRSSDASPSTRVSTSPTNSQCEPLREVDVVFHEGDSRRPTIVIRRRF